MCRLACLPALLLAFSSAFAAPDADAIRHAAQQFGKALTAGNASLLREVLPDRGKVQLHLEVLGHERGYFSPGQVEALLREFMTRGKVLSFELSRVEHDPSGYALAHAAAEVIDARGATARVRVRLAFQPEGDDEQSIKDMRRVKAAFDKAIKGSKAMVEKTKEACKKQDGTVVIFIKRDDPATRLGRTRGFLDAAFVIIDLGDLSALELALSGKPEDIKKFLDNFIITTLSHEIDHLRGDGHGDPGANAGKGKPVEDENAVMKDLGIDIKINLNAIQ